MTECIPQIRLPFHPDRPVDVAFNGPDLSSDAGCLLLRGADDDIDLSARIAALIPDSRRPDRVRHTRHEQVRQRIFQLAQGYEDCNDADTLRRDPALLLCCDLLPKQGELSSQPTLCRFENAATWESYQKLQNLMMDVFVESQPRNLRQIMLDIDGTMLKTHGGQQLALFNGHYRKSGYYPLTIWDGNGRLACLHLRPGNVHDSSDALDLLTRLIIRLRGRFPFLRIFIRGDGAFSMPQLMDGLEEISTPMSPVDFMFLIKANQRLKEITMEVSEKMSKWKYGLRRYEEFEYAAQSWSHERRIIARHESRGFGEVNTRYVVTSLNWHNARKIYRWYCKRGQSENYIKDFKKCILSERMSCEKFVVNSQRILMHGFAYILIHRVREALKMHHFSWRKITLNTLRSRILKVACRVRQSTRKILVELPHSFPELQAFRKALLYLRSTF